MDINLGNMLFIVNESNTVSHCLHTCGGQKTLYNVLNS